LLVVSVAPLRLLLAPCLAAKSIRNFFALLAEQDTSSPRKKPKIHEGHKDTRGTKEEKEFSFVSFVVSLELLILPLASKRISMRMLRVDDLPHSARALFRSCRAAHVEGRALSENRLFENEQLAAAAFRRK